MRLPGVPVKRPARRRLLAALADFAALELPCEGLCEEALEAGTRVRVVPDVWVLAGLEAPGLAAPLAEAPRVPA